VAVDEQIFVPDVGFRSADTMLARVPVTRAEGGRTVTVERAVAAPHGVDLVLTITGEPDADRRRMPSFATDPVTIVEPDGRTVAQLPGRGGFGRMGGPPASALETIRRSLTTGPVGPGTRSATLSAGGVTLPLEFEPAAVAAVPAQTLDASVERHGISFMARRIAFPPDSTAIELAVMPADERQRIDMIGLSLGPAECSVGLRDDAGRTYGGQRTLGDGYRGGIFNEIALFPALPADVRTVWLEMEHVSVIVETEELTLPVGSDQEITLAGLTAQARVLRESDEARAQRHERHAVRVSVNDPRFLPPEPPEHVIEIECGHGPWSGHRRLIRPDSAWASDRGKRCSMSFSDRGWVLHISDPSRDATEVRVSSALVQYRGPWTLEIALPERKEV